MPPDADLIFLAHPDEHSRFGEPDPPHLPVGLRVGLPPREVWVGRYGAVEGIDLTLPYAGVSRYHAALSPGPGGWRVRDLQSRNHTFVNGLQLPPGADVRLDDGDVLAICNYRILYAGEPFDRRWLTSDVVPLARGIWTENTWDRLPILGDALRDAGCEWPPLMNAVVDPGGWHDSRWAVQLLLREAGEWPAVKALATDVNVAARPLLSVLSVVR